VSRTAESVDVVGLLHDRDDLDAGERRLPAALVVVGGDPDQPVRALLDRERPVGIRRVDGEGGRLDPGLLRVGGVEDVGRPAVALGVPQVHPHEHLREVRRVDPAGLGADGDEGLAGVVLPRQQGSDLELADRPPDPAPLAVGIGVGGLPGRLVVLLVGEFVHDRDVVEA
jgi:hypothetical protein